MKKRIFIIILLVTLLIEIAALTLFYFQDTEEGQDTVLVNEVVQSVQADWNKLNEHQNFAGLDYVVLDMNGILLFKTKSGLSESIHEAVAHRDTILDIKVKGQIVGKVLIQNSSAQVFRRQEKRIIMILAAAALAQFLVCIGYAAYLNKIVIKPFQKLKGFAERIAGGNLDVPLEMDKRNIFGAFTESFDIMRSELKAARRAEAEAQADKKELVAKLSHDIKTPVASIKAASEVGAALTDNKKIKDNYSQIIRKADQINTLITNLFTATLEELKQLSVTPEDIESTELKGLLESSDYLCRSVIPDIPMCMVYADRLRLQQVFDNIFANSYKYAGTKIEVELHKEKDCLTVVIEDAGGGVSTEELPLLKEKFKRGSNAKDIEGAGLGLYISDYFMKEMKGELAVENGINGLRTMVLLSLSGRN